MSGPPILTEVEGLPVDWIGCHPDNRWSTDDGLPKLAVVVHIAEGTLAGCDSWFGNPAAQASANFCVGRNREIHQYVRLYGEAPYANGVSRSRPDKIARMNPAIRDLSERFRWASQNKWSWSIEHEGRSGQWLTDAQFDASTKLCAYLLRDAGLGVDAIFGHRDFDAIDRPRCPGFSDEQWELYRTRVGVLLAPSQHPARPSLDAAWQAIWDAEQAIIRARDSLSAAYQALRDDGLQV